VFEGYGRTFAPDSADEGVVINARDITERKRFDEALREREEHFRRLTENASDLIQVIGPGGGITYTSPSVERLLGYTPDEIAAASVLDFIHADDHDGVEAEIAALFGAPGVVRATTYRVRHRDGRWRTFEARGRTLSPTSAAEGIVVNARDVTERVEAEETLRLQKTLLEAQGEASIDGILVVSPTGQMVSFNRRFVEMWGIPPEVVASHSDEAALQAVVDQLDDPDEFLARVAHLYDHPDEESRDEIRLRDGRVLDRYSAPVRSQQGDHYGRIWFFRDITEQKRSEEALRLSHEREREHARRLERELEVGRQIQLSFLPAELLSPAGWEVDARFQPASQVAGDFYDTFGLPIGRVGLILADVCGKGVGAALFMALFRSLLRAHAERASAARMGTPHAAEAVLKEAVNATNQYIARVHKPSHLRKLGHTFASVFFGLLDPQTGTLHYVNAGHEPPIVVGPSGPRLRLPPTGPALGLTADATLEVETAVIAPNETLLAYTDGVTEARSEDGGFFDEERLLPLLDEPAPSAAALLDRIERAVHDFAAGAASDDITLMAVRRGPR
jgi:PAS domain S-box-containing protein